MVVETKVEKATILVIDDDPLLTKTLKKILQRVGYEVETAQNGYEGIEKARSGFFHLVLCDVRMPGLDGIMTIKHIQNFQKKAGRGKSGFIVISAYEYEDTKQHAHMLGVTDFVRKPFEVPEFLNLVHQSLKPLLQRAALDEVKKLNAELDRLLDKVAHPKPEKKAS